MRIHIGLILLTVLFLAGTQAKGDRSARIDYFDVTGLRDNYPSRVFTLKNISPIPIIPVLRTYIPPSGSFVGIAPIGVVILSDSKERIDLFTSLLGILDTYSQSESSNIESDNAKIADLMMQIGNRSIVCGKDHQARPKKIGRQQVDLGSYNPKWIAVIKNFLNKPDSLEMSKAEKSITFDDTDERYHAINFLIHGLQNIPVGSPDIDHKSSAASVALKNVISKGEQIGAYVLKCN